MPNKPILFLYSELAEYVLSCIAELSASTKSEIHVVKWPVKNEAPFKFRTLENVKFYKREDFSTEELLTLANQINPEVIIVSGWMDKGYIHVCKELFGTSKTVLTLDNHWFGDFKQRLKTLVAKYYFKKIFTHAWVPGEPQLPFVKKLGFTHKNTHTGFYSADIKLFQPSADSSLNYNLIYVGRYLDFKGIFELWNAFIEFKKTAKHPWTLHCVGAGDLWEKRTIHPDIVHHGFLQPAELKTLVDTCDVFVLPSHKEPWGVVAHEMAACGLTLLCSEKIGASTAFLINGENGFSFESKDEGSLCNALKKVDHLSPEEFTQFRNKSIELSQKISPKKWVDTLLNIASE